MSGGFVRKNERKKEKSNPYLYWSVALDVIELTEGW